MFRATRYHDFSYGHRVVGHETCCKFLHGHNGRIHFICQAEKETEDLDKIGRVIDFSEIKSRLCMWLENNWDHKFLHWEEDPVLLAFRKAAHDESCDHLITDLEGKIFTASLVSVPFNPTAENMAKYLVEVIGPQQLAGTGIRLIRCIVEETRKCSAEYGVGQR